MDLSARGKVMQLASLLQLENASEDDIREQMQEYVSSLSSDVMRSAVENPLETLELLGAIASKGNEVGDLDVIQQLAVEFCQGDLEYAQDVYSSCGNDISKARKLLVQQETSQFSGTRDERFIFLIQLCRGNEEFAQSIYESAGNDVEKAIALMEGSMNVS